MPIIFFLDFQNSSIFKILKYIFKLFNLCLRLLFEKFQTFFSKTHILTRYFQNGKIVSEEKRYTLDKFIVVLRF